MLPRSLFTVFIVGAFALVGCSSGDHVLEVQPDGEGRVYSASLEHDTLGIDCRSDGKTRRGACVTDLALVDSYTLVAEPAPGAVFDHWEVDPSGPEVFAGTDSRITLAVDKGVTSTRHVRAVFR
jgi:hypothetical protein